MDSVSANTTQLAIYDHLRVIAESYSHRERQTHTLRATALLNELFLRLVTSMETAELPGQSRARVDRDVNFALSCLHQRLPVATSPTGEQNSAGLRHS